MTNDVAHVLSPEEMKAVEQEIGSLYGAPPVPQSGNAALNSLFENFNAEKITNKGHKIISARVFKKMVAENIPFEQEHVYMIAENGSIAALPARKYTKYYGEGRRLVEDSDTEPQTEKNTKETITIDGQSYDIFFCDVKYSDCKRFFDSSRGRGIHWKADHEKAWSRKANKDA